MSSILTNTSAMVALQTLKGINANLQQTQAEISTGKAVGSAKDNSAVWAISKVMEADVNGFTAISDHREFVPHRRPEPLGLFNRPGVQLLVAREPQPRDQPMHCRPANRVVRRPPDRLQIVALDSLTTRPIHRSTP